MSRRAWFYVLTVMGLGTISGALAFLRPTAELDDLAALLVLSALAAYMQMPKSLFKSDNASETSYSPILVTLFAGVLLLPPPFFVLLVLIPHLVEWLKERLTKSPHLRSWYIQPFNISVHILGGLTAQLVVNNLALDNVVPFLPPTLLAALAAAFVYVVLNHLLIGEALVLARGVSWKDSGVLRWENLLPDFSMLILGCAVALLWNVNPWLIITALSPLVFIHRALKVPQLEKEASLDDKTGLLNSRALVKALEVELERATRFNRPLAVVLGDLDLLRNINNTYGHLAGDMVLATIGKILRESLREFDIAARFGGEEFVIVLPESDTREARKIAERLREIIGTHPFVVHSSPTPIHVTMSLGVACLPADGVTTIELIHQADLAVYQAKLRGRNRVVMSSEVPRSEKLPNVAATAERLGLPAIPPDAAAMPQAAQETVFSPAAGTPAEAAAPAPAASKRILPTRLVTRRYAFVGYVAAVILASIGLTVAFADFSSGDIWMLVVFTMLIMLVQWFQMEMNPDAAVSVSVGISFAVALINGMGGVAVVSAAGALMHRVRNLRQSDRTAFYKTPFNWAIHVLAGAVPALLVRPLGIPLALEGMLTLAIPITLAALAYSFLDTFLLAAGMSLSKGQSTLRTWRDEFQWLASHYVALCFMGFILAVAYTALGILGIVVFTLPLLMMQLVVKQYIERTDKSARETRRMNVELSQANREILTASLALQQVNEEILLTLSKIIDARDPFVSGHASKVAECAIAIANEMGLTPEQITTVRQAALLHDLGKLGISETILHKPARLTADEYDNMKRHTTLGADWLQTSGGLQYLAPLVKHHHEWWNGAGYPDGLRGEEIPLEARLISVCDAIEAMASDRPYHRAMPLPAILAEIKRCAGSQFDPQVVDAFLRVSAQSDKLLVVNSAREIWLRTLDVPRGNGNGGHAYPLPPLHPGPVPAEVANPAE